MKDVQIKILLFLILVIIVLVIANIMQRNRLSIDVLRELNWKLYYYNTDVARQEDAMIMTLLLDSLGVMSVPTIIYVVDGVLIGKLQGMQTFEDLNTFFIDYLEK